MVYSNCLITSSLSTNSFFLLLSSRLTLSNSSCVLSNSNLTSCKWLCVCPIILSFSPKVFSYWCCFSYISLRMDCSFSCVTYSSCSCSATFFWLSYMSFPLSLSDYIKVFYLRYHDRIYDYSCWMVDCSYWVSYWDFLWDYCSFKSY